MTTVEKQPISGVLVSLAFLSCGCSSVLDFGDERSLEPDAPALLYAQDFETSSGDSNCQQEQPAFSDAATLDEESQRDCDAANDPLSGGQNLNLWDDGQLFCRSCWEPHDGTLWTSFLFTVKGENFTAVPFALITGTPVVLKEPYLAVAGPEIFMRPGGSVGLYCDATKVQLSVERGGIWGRATFSYDWRSGQGRLWVSGFDMWPSVTEPPTVELVCPGHEPATGYFVLGRVKPAPGFGNLELDEIRVATSAEALAEP